jgi:hypothetical protein
MRKESVIEAVRQKIAEVPTGKIFGYDLFGELAGTKRRALTRALSRLVKSEELKRAYTANFYRPDWCKYGAVPIFDAERIKSLGNVYVTGFDAHNMLGISTQIPFVMTIAHPTKHYRRRLGRLRIKYVRSTLKEIPDDVDAPLLMILDSIKDLKYIQDAMPDDAVSRILWIIKKLLEKDRVEKLAEYALYYPPRVRAILGAILEHARYKRLRSILKATLNPNTEYLVGLDDSLPNLKTWKLRGLGRTDRAWKRRWEKRKKCSTDT